MASIAPELVIDHSLQPQVDGYNREFTTQYDYIPGTLTVYWNGQALVDTKGVLELPPNRFTLENDTNYRTPAPTTTHNFWASYMA